MSIYVHFYIATQCSQSILTYPHSTSSAIPDLQRMPHSHNSTQLSSVAPLSIDIYPIIWKLCDRPYILLCFDLLGDIHKGKFKKTFHRGRHIQLVSGRLEDQVTFDIYRISFTSPSNSASSAAVGSCTITPTNDIQHCSIPVTAEKSTGHTFQQKSLTIVNRTANLATNIAMKTDIPPQSPGPGAKSTHSAELAQAWKPNRVVSNVRILHCILYCQP